MQFLKRFLPVIFFFNLSCAPTKEKEVVHITQKTVSLSFAEGFQITYLQNAKLVEVITPYQGALQGQKYLLVKNKDEAPSIPGATTIEIPIDRLVCTSTTHIPLLDYLDETNSLIGFPSLDFISSSKMRKRIDDHKIQELGMDKSLNIELLTALHPDMIMAYSISGNYGQFKKIESLGIPVIINAEYLERHPLGRAEWIKFVAAFFNKEEMADSVFQHIVNAYHKTKKTVDDVTHRPTVMSGILYGDSWFLPGGQNNVATLFQDAGFHYLWSADSSGGFIQVSFESVFNHARQADYWIGTGDYKSLQGLKDADFRYATFDAWKKQNVYTYNLRIGPTGGNEYLELGYLRPDLVLKDLVYIAHPDRLPNHKLFFHKKLP